MSDQSVVSERLFGSEAAFAHPVTLWLSVGVASLLVATPLIVMVLAATGRVSAKLRAELDARWRSWLVIAPLMLVPVLAGPAFTIGAVCLLSLMCYREFARATGGFRARRESLVVVLGVALLTLASVDHWYNLFVAVTPLAVMLIAVVSILADEPKGYIQRVSVAAFGFLFFGACLGHLGYFANDPGYRPMLLMILVCVELSDIAAYICGKTFGRRKLCPNTSPSKTLGGALGSLVFTTALVATIGRWVFAGTAMDSTGRLIGLGIIVGVLAQLGDLMLSSVKRDLGVKDLGTLFPGHGGLLDRFDSLVLVAPAAFHFIGYFNGIGVGEPIRVFTAP